MSLVKPENIMNVSYEDLKIAHITDLFFEQVSKGRFLVVKTIFEGHKCQGLYFVAQDYLGFPHRFAVYN